MHSLSLTQAFPGVQIPLVGAATEADLIAFAALQKRPVYEDIRFLQEGFPRWILVEALQQLFNRIACIGDDIKAAQSVDIPCKAGQDSGLCKWLTAAEGHAAKQGIGLDLFQQLLRSDLCAAVKVVGLGIVTSGAAVRTALREDGEPEARSVYDGIIHDSSDAYVHAYHL